MSEEKEAKAGILGFLSSHKREIFIILIIFLLGFTLRAHLMKYELIFEFDTYWDARITGYVIETGSIPAKDPLGYYQLGGATVPQLPLGPSGFFITSAAIYKIFTFGAPYSKEQFLLFAKLIPAVYGALAAVAVYFLFRKGYGKRAAIFGGFFTAASSAFIYRTMAGFFEGASAIFFWIALGFMFFVMAAKDPKLKRTNIIFAVLSALCLIISTTMAGWYLIAIYVALAYVPLMLIIMYLRKVENKKIIAFLVICLISLGGFIAVTSVLNPGWQNSAVGYVAKYIPQAAGSSGSGQPTTIEGQIQASTTGEQNTGIQFFGTKYNALIIFPIIALILIPIRMWRKKNDYISLLLFFWILSTFVMAWLRLQMTFAFGLGLAVAAGFVCNELFELFQDRDKFEKLIIAGAVSFMVLVAVASSMIFVENQPPNIEMQPGWKDALRWTQANTPVDAKVFNWWDEGHWISYLAERKVSTDNRNYIFKANSDFAKFILADNAKDARAIIDEYDADYIIYGDDMFTKPGSMGVYAYETLNYNDPRLTSLFGFAVGCGKNIDSLSGAVSYQCGGNNIGAAEMASLPTVWQAQPNQFLDERTPVFVYRSTQNDRLYVINGALNEKMLAKMWFHDPGVTDYAEVYYSNGVKVFRVNQGS